MPDDLSDARMQLLKMAEGLIANRFHVARLVSGLKGAGDETEEAALRANLECAIVDHFDPLLKTVLKAAGDL
jgi:hypothetical protein